MSFDSGLCYSPYSLLLSYHKMRNNRNYKKQGNKNPIKQKAKSFHKQAQDEALVLRKEFPGQVCVVMKIKAQPVILTTTVTSGIIQYNNGISVSDIFSFSARFIAFSECRIVKVKMHLKNFNCSTPGIGISWFSEDDATTPTASSSLDAYGKQYNFANIVDDTVSYYTPHDPAQQTWTLVSSGSPTVIGYHKVFTNAAEYGAPIAVTNVGVITYDYTVQFRGLV